MMNNVQVTGDTFKSSQQKVIFPRDKTKPNTAKTYCPSKPLTYKIFAKYKPPAFSDLTAMFLVFDEINSVYASIAGGFLMGVGFLMLFRHNASLGGINILARYVAEKYGISMGKFQMVLDCFIVLGAMFFVDVTLIAISFIGAIALNIVIAVNHKPGRYMGNV